LTVEVADDSKDTWSVPPQFTPLGYITIPDTVGTSYPTGSTTMSVQLQLANPQLPPGTCAMTGLDVAIVADLSQSMIGASMSALRDSASTFIKALVGTESTVALFTFGRVSPAPNSDGKTNNENYPDPASVKTQEDVDDLIAIVEGWEALDGNYTNWDAAMRAVASAETAFHLVLFITDGQPNMIVRSGTSNTAPADNDLATANVASTNAVKAQGSRVLVMYVNSSTLTSTYRQRIVEISGPSTSNTDIASADYVTAPDWDAFKRQLHALVTTACQKIDVVYVDETLGYKVVPIAPPISFTDRIVGDEVEFTDTIAEANVPYGYKLVEVPYSFALGEDDYVVNKVWQLDREDSLSKLPIVVDAVPTVIYVILEHVYGPAEYQATVNCTVKYKYASDEGEIEGYLEAAPDDQSLFTTWTVILDLATGEIVRYETTETAYTDDDGEETVWSPDVTGYTPNLFTVTAAVEQSSVTDLPTCTKYVIYTPRSSQNPDQPYRGPDAATGGSVSTLPLLGQSVGLLAILAGAVMLIRRRGVLT